MPDALGAWKRRLLAITLAVAFSSAQAQAQSNAVYAATCGLCHQNAAVGVKGQFPRLAGRVDRLAAEPEGRDYLIHTVLFGMAGKIDVDGASIVGVMPSFSSLSDSDLASVLNYLIRLKKAKQVKAVAPTEIAVVRNDPHSSPTDVATLRRALVAAGRMP